MIDTPEKLQPVVARVRECGIGVCLRLGLICRPTREEAVRVAESLLPEDKQESTTRLKDDSQMYREAAGVTQRRALAEPIPSGPGWPRTTVPSGRLCWERRRSWPTPFLPTSKSA